MTQPPTLADQAYDVIEEMIVTLALPPGSVFSEQDLSHRIEIGRTPMREALLRLVGDRLLKSMPRRGMLVTEVNITDHLRILETRRVLDRLIVERAARRADDAQKETMRQCAAGIHEAAEAGNLEQFMKRDRELDQTLGQASGNIYAAESAAMLYAHCRRFWYVYKAAGDLRKSAALHEALVEAVAAGDEARAGAASDQLIDYLEAFTRDVLTH